MTKRQLEILRKKYLREGYKMALREAYNEDDINAYDEWGIAYDPDAYDIWKDEHLDDEETRFDKAAADRWRRDQEMLKAKEVRSCKDANGKIIKKGDKVGAFVNGERVYGSVYRIIPKDKYASMKSGRYLVDINNQRGKDTILGNLEVRKDDGGPLYKAWRNLR